MAGWHSESCCESACHLSVFCIGASTQEAEYCLLLPLLQPIAAYCLDKGLGPSGIMHTWLAGEVQRIMGGVAHLAVPLKVNVTYGRRWGCMMPL